MRLISYSSGESGSMMGGRSSLSISYTDDGRCRVSSSQSVGQSLTTKCVTYYAEGLLDKLSEVCERYNVIEWKDVPGPKIFMVDAGTSRQTFSFENGVKICFESGKRYPEYAGDMFSEIDALITESESYAVDVEVSEETFGMGMMGMMGMMNMMNDQNKQVVKDPDYFKRNEDTSAWAGVCDGCGTPFTGAQKFCAECGAARRTC